MKKKAYISPMRRFRSADQAQTVLTLLGYAMTVDRNGRVVPRVWESKATHPNVIALEVGEQFPHRVVVRAVRRQG